MKANACEVVLGATAMEITRKPVASNNTELIPKAAISAVYPVKINSKASWSSDDQAKWPYRFPVMTIICLELVDGSRQELELQEVENQATWNLGTLAAQQQAIDDINAWLP
jgi:hypothetical protein